MKRHALILLSMAALTSQGCSTLWDLSHSHDILGEPESHGPHIYGGTRLAFHEFGRKPGFLPAWMIHTLLIIDLPFSLVLDTILLPVSLPMELFRPRLDDSAKKPR